MIKFESGELIMGVYITKSCVCTIRDKNNWIRTEHISMIGKSTLVFCEKCRSQWRSKAKYIYEIKKAGWIRD